MNHLVHEAATSAYSAFRDYSRRPGIDRARFLRRIAEGILGLEQQLIRVAGSETSLPESRLVSERGRTCLQLRLFADLAESGTWVDERVDPADPARQPIAKPRVRSMLRPIGPVAVFGASNFPLAFSVAGGDTAAALAVGCPVIVKAHPAHPDTSALVGKVIEESARECGMPQGVFALLPASDQEIGIDLVQHPLVKAGAFTGSQRGGLALWRAAQARPDPIPFFAEMGSVNPVFVFPGAIAARAAQIATGLHASITASVGQFCTQPGIVFLPDTSGSRDFLDRLTALIAGTPPGKMLTQQMQSAYRQSIEIRGNTREVRTVVRASEGETASAALHLTQSNVFARSPALREEIFGPVSLVVLCKDVVDFRRCAEVLEGQLTATIWSEPGELDDQDDFLWSLEQKVGRIVFNGFPTGVEVGSAMMHGGPFPATTDVRFTSVGTRSIYRFVRPAAWQTSA